MSASSEPLNRNYFGQGTDQAFTLGLVDRESLLASFKLNCLFFEHISLPAADLLGNPVLFSMFDAEPAAAHQLYSLSKVGGAGVIQPMLVSDFDNIEEVADSMIRDSVIHSLPGRRDLRRHARLISDSQPNYLWCDLSEFRMRYYELILELARKLAAQPTRSNSKILPTKEESRVLLDWLISKASKDNLRCSDVFRFIDSASTKRKKRLKVLAETVYQYTASGMQTAALSTPASVVPIIAQLKALDSSPLTQVEDGTITINDEELAILLPIDKVSLLRLEHILTLRASPAFSKARGILANFRWGTQQDLHEIQRVLDECAWELVQYSNGTELQKERFIQDIQRRVRAAKVRMLSNVAIAAGGILLMVAGSNALTTILGVGVNLAPLLVRGDEGSPNAIHSERSVNEHSYLPVIGREE